MRLVIRGVAALRGPSLRRPEDAVPFFERAIARDPSYGIAYGFLALAKIMIAGYGQAPIAVLEAAQAMASKAMDLSPDQEIGPRVRSAGAASPRTVLTVPRPTSVSRSISIATAPTPSSRWAGCSSCAASRCPPSPGSIARFGSIRFIPHSTTTPAASPSTASVSTRRLRRHSSARLSCRPGSRSGWPPATRSSATRPAPGATSTRAMAIDPNYQAVWHARERMPFEHAADAEHLAEGIELAIKHAG